MTLKDLLKIARSQEAVDRLMKLMVSNAGVGRNKRSACSKICYACGHDGDFSRDKRRPARGQIFLKCGGIGHFKDRCPQGLQSGAVENGEELPAAVEVFIVEAGVWLGDTK